MNQVDVAVNTQVEMVESNQINAASPAEYEVDYREKKGYEIVKRAFDIVASLCALTVLSPIFLITIIAIFLTDFGSPFFVQDRAGKNGELFKIYKFRSMYIDSDIEKEELMARNEMTGGVRGEHSRDIKARVNRAREFAAHRFSRDGIQKKYSNARYS